MASTTPRPVRRPAAAEGRTFAIFGSLITFKTEPQDNGNAFLQRRLMAAARACRIESFPPEMKR